MARLPPLPIEHTPELGDRFEFFVGTLGEQFLAGGGWRVGKHGG